MVLGKVVDYGGRCSFLTGDSLNLEELGSSHLGSGRLRVVPTWSYGLLFPCCNIGVAEAGLKAIVWPELVASVPEEAKTLAVASAS
ncbi:uncharacterized protein G2W53_017536 [Senna tora]|uniref:Uncharacterized protein n=1 Tax=Senna tora TaxID=362788 RepID=A0A834WKL0_9FABA|nr:uncharacterized protein G2W53_017536 [Senna tora]